METDELKPAPQPLQLVQQFLNTRSLMRNFDLLDTPLSFAIWCEEVAGMPLEQMPEDRELRRYKSLREALRAVLLAHISGSPAEKASAAQALNRVTGPDLLQASFNELAEPKVSARADTEPSLEGRLMEAAVDAHYKQTWARLKVCANEDCRWSFFDSSKNRSATWCDMAICGSRAKMRLYRQRHNSS
ncbi:hypothetical protein FEF26_08385 [Nesterenkonia salmonea]|uniref:Zinc finger CGNR domain-containing protein n=1 Tax=Nesterenkonia salmonea TaxID=1804987 RepID=A0A5R9BAH4_9MICC|nr:CGNR zinc finger domain-containing protein [Nesterenkonia salmonea]TLP96990.1 hypothetical protein FEF26_08385 [Nesterenkonia salmonea]